MPLDINTVITGKSLEVIKTFPDESINCVITSPPYWQLRDYGWDGQWGLEPTYQMYLENLWSLMDEIWRVLKKDGTVWINLGDTYGGSKAGNTDNKISNRVNSEGPGGVNKINDNEKCLLLIPHRFAIGCIDRGWVLRNDIIWAKRNAMPESVTDRFSKKHEYFFFMVKNKKYYFDLDGIRDKVKILNGYATKFKNRKTTAYFEGEYQPNPKGKNPSNVSDFWSINTKPSSKDHYGAYNNALIEKPIIAGCPKGGIILDPFCGTGTTLARALQLGRNVIGIEGKAEYCRLANEMIAVNYSPLNFV